MEAVDAAKQASAQIEARIGAKVEAQFNALTLDLKDFLSGFLNPSSAPSGEGVDLATPHPRPVPTRRRPVVPLGGDDVGSWGDAALAASPGPSGAAAPGGAALGSSLVLSPAGHQVAQ